MSKDLKELIDAENNAAKLFQEVENRNLISEGKSSWGGLIRMLED